jgi:hypothetical protein
MIDQAYLEEMVDNYAPIKGFNRCMINPVYRIGEFFTVTYDYDKFAEKLMKTKKIEKDEVYDYIKNNFDVKNVSFVKIFPKETCNRDNVALFDEDMLFCDGLDDALVGYRVGFNENKNIAAYDYDLCIVSLMTNDEMSEEDAMEWMSYNTMDSYVGEYTPCFIHRI